MAIERQLTWDELAAENKRLQEIERLAYEFAGSINYGDREYWRNRFIKALEQGE